MSRIFEKILMVIVISLILVINSCQIVLGADFWGDIFKTGENFINEGKAASGSGASITVNEVELQHSIEVLYDALFRLGVVVTVIIGGTLGIKFMVASADDKAKVKESMVPYIIGCVAIFGAFTIWKICIEVFSALA